MTAPELTKEQRLENLEKAKRMRNARAKIREKLADGTYSVADVIGFASDADHAAYGMRVKQMINALPGYGFSRTQQTMSSLGIAENKRIGGLGRKQAQALIAKLDGVTA